MAKKRTKMMTTTICGPPLECFVVARITSQTKTIVGRYMTMAEAKADLQNKRKNDGARYLPLTEEEFTTLYKKLRTVAPSLEKQGIEEIKMPKERQVIQGIRYTKGNPGKRCDDKKEKCYVVVLYKIDGKTKQLIDARQTSGLMSENDARRLSRSFSLANRKNPTVEFDLMEVDDFEEMVQEMRVKASPGDGCGAERAKLETCTSNVKAWTNLSKDYAEISKGLASVAKQLLRDAASGGVLTDVEKDKALHNLNFYLDNMDKAFKP